MGRVVHYHDHQGKTLPAMITEVHNDTCVSLVAFEASHAGPVVPYISVPQGVGAYGMAGCWSWPPYVAPASAGAKISPVSEPPIGGLVRDMTPDGQIAQGKISTDEPEKKTAPLDGNAEG